VSAAADDLDRAGRNAEPPERGDRELVLLRHPDAATAQRRRTPRQLGARQDDARSQPQAIQARGLERPIGGRARQHHDGVGVWRQRIGDDEEISRVAHGDGGASGEEEQGDVEELVPQHRRARG